MTEARLRVLLVLGTSTGGIGQHVRSLAHGLVDRHHQVVVAGPLETDQLFGFGTLGARFVSTPIGVTPTPRDLAVARQLGRWVRGADVVHAHGFRAGLVALASGAGSSWPVAGVRRADVPLIVTWHNQVLTTGVRGAAMHRAERIVARGASLNLGASSDLVRQAIDSGGKAELGLVAAPQVTEPDRERTEVRAELGIDEAPMLLAVGRLHPQKDYPTMLKAVAQLQSRTPQPVLVIAGDGPDATHIAALAGQLSVRARLLGRRDDIADLMRAADVLVLSSVWEARALVVQEAMQLGLPVVATDVGGIPDLVGDAALVVPSNAPKSLAGALEEVLDNPDEAHKRADRAREVAARWPDEDAVVDRVLQAYEEVGAGAGRPR
ncbi:MAG: glycosyltransferase family 4 protein [Actinomycetes bacterium]